MSEPTAPVLPGETFAGKYRVERLLGQGGMGVVVAARHLQLEERVAIKFLVGEPSEAAVDRFLREARAAVKVKGEHVCRVFDFGRLETGEPYIVMEHLEGTDLAHKLEKDGPQPVASAVGWVIEACDALAEAHAAGIVHRDLKPANVFLAKRPDGSACAKILDFGISKLPAGSTMTRTATMMGSPVYMSPEQMESARDVDARSDLWSLGIMLYELISGELPFVGESMVQLAVKVREKDPIPLETLVPEVPDALARTIAKCMSKKAKDRHANVAELAAELAPFAPPEVAPLVARLASRLDVRASHSKLALQATARQSPGVAKAAAAPEGAGSEDDAAASGGGPSPMAVSREAPENITGPRKTSDAPVKLAKTAREEAVVARGRGTFAPLQSTLGGDSPRARPRWMYGAAAVVVLVVGSLGVRSWLSASGAPVPVTAEAAVLASADRGAEANPSAMNASASPSAAAASPGYPEPGGRPPGSTADGAAETASAARSADRPPAHGVATAAAHRGSKPLAAAGAGASGAGANASAPTPASAAVVSAPATLSAAPIAPDSARPGGRPKRSLDRDDP